MNIGSWALLLLCMLRLHFGCTQQQPELTLKDMAVKAINHLKITGIPMLNGSRFFTDIGNELTDIGLHFDVRFDYLKDHHIIVINSRKDGTWYTEQRDKRFPFKQGEKCKVTFKFSKENFTIKMPKDYTETYNYYFGFNNFKLIQVLQDVKFKNFNID